MVVFCMSFNDRRIGYLEMGAGAWLVVQPTGGKVTGQQREQIEEAVRQHDKADGPGDAQAGEVRETGEKAE